jgi:hypothetical protein
MTTKLSGSNYNYIGKPTADTQYAGTNPDDILSQLLQIGQGDQPGGTGFGMPAQKPGMDLSGIGSIGQGIAGLMAALTGMKGIKLGEKQLDFTKDSTNRNLANQAQTVNSELRDRQARRLDASPGNYQSVSDYMKQNSVDGSKI